MSHPAEPASNWARSGVSIRHLIEERALFTSDAAAVIDGDGRVFSWHELNARANALADRICQAGAGPDHPVGLLGRSSAVTVLAWLAALKADAPVVPLGENLNAAASRTFTQAGARLLLCAGVSVELQGVPTISVRFEGRTPATPNLGSRSRADHPAFIIAHANGTLRIGQRDLDELVRWEARTFDAAHGGRVCVLLPVAEIGGLRMIAGTLGLGGTLILPPTTGATPSAIWDFLQGSRVTRLCLATEQLDEIVQAEETRGSTLESLRDLVVLGKTLRLTPDVLRFFSIHAPCRVHTLHAAPDAAAIGACTLELPFADLSTRRPRTKSADASVLQRAGAFSARLTVPAVA